MTKSDHIEMSQFAISIFRDDGKLDIEELEVLVKIALRDSTMSEDEKRVLRSILDRLNFDDLNRELILKIEQLEQRFDF
ncbi:hypothetical protein [Pleionea litopenaei]|uniref:Tellurite resistance protein TerB n=1 Tax=Pleionea litopenaei TaxID=3070815 RepID=A0AA51RQV5_9GAMM|nr:hypothetical protein [Pleionea sp. HL-JVS1]WMS85789.1 hypothetical protein Q9312_11235 [Pleionea sp. HL-JVS1]